MQAIPLGSKLLAAIALLLGGVAASIASASPSDPAMLIANGDNAELSQYLQDHPEAVFEKFNGSTLLIQAVQSKNVDAIVELISRGADWLVETNDGLPFCKLAHSRLAVVDRVGSAIEARLLRERKLLDQGRYRDFIDLRLAAQQGSDYLEATRTTCGEILNWSEYKLGWTLLLSAIDGPSTDEEADSLFRQLILLKLVNMPPLPTSNYLYTVPLGNIRDDLQQRAPKWSDIGVSPWSEVVKHLLRRHMKASIELVLSPHPSPEQLSELFRESSALSPRKDLRQIIYYYTHYSDSSRNIAKSAPFLNMVIAAGLWSKLDYNFTLRNITDSGDFYAVIPEAVLEFENNSSRELFDAVLDGEIPPRIQTCETAAYVIAGELRTDPERDNCAIDEQVFFRTTGSRLTFDEFLKISHFGVALGYSWCKDISCHSLSTYTHDIDHVSTLLWRFIRSGIATKAEVESFVKDNNLMRNYVIRYSDIKEYLYAHFVTKKNNDNAVDIDLIALAKSRGLNCEKAQEGWSFFEPEDFHHCHIFLNGQPASVGLWAAAAGIGMTVYP